MSRMYRLLPLILVFVLLPGCDSESRRGVLIGLNISSPKSSDINYNDVNLDPIWQEISLYQVEPERITAEYSWIQYRNRHCNEQTSKSASECLATHNLKRSKILNQTLTHYILSVETTNSITSSYEIADPLFIESSDHITYFPAITYSGTSGRIAHLTSKGSVKVVDARTGKLIKEIDGVAPGLNQSIQLELSSNGLLLLITFRDKSFLYSVTSGHILNSLEGFERGTPQFILEGQYIVYRKNGMLNIAASDTFLTKATTSRSTNLHAEFDVSSDNKILSWGSFDQTIFLFRIIEESGSPTVRSPIRFQLPSEINDKVATALINPDNQSATVITPEHILNLNFSDSKFTRISPNPTRFTPTRIAVKENYIWLFARRKEARGTQGISVIHKKTGSIAFNDIIENHINWVDLPKENSVLIATQAGVHKLKIYPTSLTFINYEQEYKNSNEPNSSKSSRFSSSIPTPPPPSTSTSLPQQKLIFKCEDTLGRTSHSDLPCSNNNRTIDIVNTEQTTNIRASESNPVVLAPGKEGINTALKQRAIRVGSSRDLSAWKAKNSASEKILGRLPSATIYVIQKPISFSGGLGGSNSAIFIVHSQGLSPTGDIGHSLILYSENGGCQGVLCIR